MSFSELGLPESIVKAATDAGYTQATPIQAEAIPILLAGHDLVGCSRTGSGKTAAFAMPFLAKVDLSKRHPQVLVLAPTRELAVQVAEAFEQYSASMKDLRVLAVYGGAAYQPQISALRRGVHVIVGTPGRLIDHIKQETISLAGVHSLVLDEADEMLRMGFIDDVRWVLDKVPEGRQVALFSATMPEPIREIAQKQLRDPKSITVDTAQRGVSTIRQEHVVVSPKNKIEVLCRLLEVEKTDGVIVFVKTKLGTVEVADRLLARGFNAAALNGDIAQTQRQRTVDKLKEGEIDILVATDVAARGLDVDRVSHVFNFDLPHDDEAYVHRIGRTGRAGREGVAILLVTPSQRRVIRSIERATGQTILHREQPPVDQINVARAERFKARITEAMTSRQLDTLAGLVKDYCEQTGEEPLRVAAALAVMTVGDHRFFARPIDEPSLAPRERPKRDRIDNDYPSRERAPRDSFPRDGGDSPKRFRREGNESVVGEPAGERKFRERFDADRKRHDKPTRFERGARSGRRYRLEVGSEHGVQPGQLFGAIAHHTGLSSEEIGKIRIMDQFSIVDLPAGMPADVFKALSKTWVAGRQLRITEDGFVPQQGSRDRGESSPADTPSDRPAFKPKKAFAGKPKKAFAGKPFKTGAGKPFKTGAGKPEGAKANSKFKTGKKFGSAKPPR